MTTEKNSQKSLKKAYIFDRILTAQNTFLLQKMFWICKMLSVLISSWLSMNVHQEDLQKNTLVLQWSEPTDGQSDQKNNG